MPNASPVRCAACRCGALSATCLGEPVRVSVCHCLACQQRSGSAFATQARFPKHSVTIAGESRRYLRRADSGRTVSYLFCPDCGSTVAYENEGMPGLIAIPVGAFADPEFPPPRHSVYEERKHPWVTISGDHVAHEQ